MLASFLPGTPGMGWPELGLTGSNPNGDPNGVYPGTAI